MSPTESSSTTKAKAGIDNLAHPSATSNASLDADAVASFDKHKVADEVGAEGSIKTINDVVLLDTTPKKEKYSPGSFHGAAGPFVRTGFAEIASDPFKSSPSNDAQASAYTRSERRRADLEATKASTISSSGPPHSPLNHHQRRKLERELRRISASSSPTTGLKASRLSGNWRSSSSDSDNSPTDGSHALAFRMKSGSPSKQISSRNAQAVYPPSACVFVANLNHNEDEQELEYAVTKLFREFGTVFVKIRRDAKNMPFAFCQFTSDDAAHRAVTEGKGRLIHGRPCRTEPAKAHRTFLLARVFGEPITVAEAREVLRSFGTIENAWMPSNTENSLYGLRGGAFVTFKYYETGRDAMSALRDNTQYVFTMMTPTESSPRANKPRLLDGNAARTYLDKYEVDRRSIFVGSLPQDATEKLVNDVFAQCGTILGVVLHRCRSVREGFEFNVFAFVEFEDPLAAQEAITTKHNSSINGSNIKVTNKNSDRARDERPARRSANSDRQSLTYRSPLRVAEIPMSPPMYNPHYGYTGFPPTPSYSGGYGGFYSHAQYAAAYSPNYFSGSPGYIPRVSGSDTVVGNLPYHTGYTYPSPDPYSAMGQYYSYSPTAYYTGNPPTYIADNPVAEDSATLPPQVSTAEESNVMEQAAESL